MNKKGKKEENKIPLCSIELIYEIDNKNSNVELLGDNFIINNMKNCKLLINKQIFFL